MVYCNLMNKTKIIVWETNFTGVKCINRAPLVMQLLASCQRHTYSFLEREESVEQQSPNTLPKIK